MELRINGVRINRSRPVLDKTRLVARSHCTGPGQGPGTGTGQGTMDFYIMLCTVYITQGPGPGTGTGTWTNGLHTIHHRDWYWLLY